MMAQNNMSALVAMLAGGLQGYSNMKNEQQIREEQRAARQEQLALQKQMMAMQEDQDAWQRSFSEKSMLNANEQAALARLDAKEARGEQFTHEEKMLQMQLRAAAAKARGPGAKPDYTLFGAAMSQVQAAATAAERSAYEQGLTGQEAANYVENARMTAILSLPPGLQSSVYGITPGGYSQQPSAPAAPTVPITGNPTVDAIRAKQAQDAANQARMKQQGALVDQGASLLAEELARGGVSRQAAEQAALDPSNPSFLEANQALGINAREQQREPYRASQRKVIPGGYGVIP